MLVESFSTHHKKTFLCDDIMWNGRGRNKKWQIQ